MQEFYQEFMHELAILQYKIDLNRKSPKESVARNFEKRFGQSIRVDEVKDKPTICQTALKPLNSISNYLHNISLIFWLRMIISLFIQENKNQFEDLIAKTTKKELGRFIHDNIEDANQPSNSIAISALSAALHIPFRYAYVFFMSLYKYK